MHLGCWTMPLPPVCYSPTLKARGRADERAVEIDDWLCYLTAESQAAAVPLRLLCYTHPTIFKHFSIGMPPQMMNVTSDSHSKNNKCNLTSISLLHMQSTTPRSLGAPAAAAAPLPSQLLWLPPLPLSQVRHPRAADQPQPQHLPQPLSPLSALLLLLHAWLSRLLLSLPLGLPLVLPLAQQ
jgi:hypothetical protein